MDFELTETQREIREASAAILRRRAGADRARSLGPGATYDHELEAALLDGGYLALAAEDEAGPLDAAFLVEQVAAALGTIAIGAKALVLPALDVEAPAGPVAIASGFGGEPARFAGAGTTTAVIAEGGDAWLCEVSAEPVESRWGYPLGRLRVTQRDSLGPGSEATLVRWWQVAIAAELVGTMAAALDLVVQYVKDRVQFDRPLGSLQAIQHRLAHAHVRVEGSRWLTYHAAWSGAPDDAAALAATHAATSGRGLVRELHQLCGAIGLTEEFDLQLWTMRIRALYLEAGACRPTHRPSHERSTG